MCATLIIICICMCVYALHVYGYLCLHTYEFAYLCVCMCVCVCMHAKDSKPWPYISLKTDPGFQVSLYDEAALFRTIKVWYRCPYVQVSWSTGLTPADQWVNLMLWCFKLVLIQLNPQHVWSDNRNSICHTSNNFGIGKVANLTNSYLPIFCLLITSFYNQF